VCKRTAYTSEDCCSIGVGNSATYLTCQNNSMRSRVFGAAHIIGIPALEPANHAQIEKGVDDPIDRDQCQPCAFLCQTVKYLIGADRFVGSGDFSKDFLAQRRKRHLVTAECLARRPHGVVNTWGMIMLRCWKCIAHHVVHHGPSVTSVEATNQQFNRQLGHRLSGATTLHRVCQS